VNNQYISTTTKSQEAAIREKHKTKAPTCHSPGFQSHLSPVQAIQAGVHVIPRCSPHKYSKSIITLRKHLLQICKAHLITPRPVSPLPKAHQWEGLRLRSPKTAVKQCVQDWDKECR